MARPVFIQRGDPRKLGTGGDHVTEYQSCLSERPSPPGGELTCWKDEARNGIAFIHFVRDRVEIIQALSIIASSP